MENKKQIIVADDHDLFREGLIELLKKSGSFEVVGEAKNGKELLDIVGKQKPDVVIMDIQMPEIDGIEATRQALKIHPGLNILALSMFGDEENYFRVINAGAKGFILKTAVFSELEKAIEEVTSNGSYFSNELLRKILHRINDQTKKAEAEEKTLSSLSKREVEILKLVAEGRSNEEIVNLLNISLATVKSHRSSLLSKTSCTNSASLVMFAVKNKLVEVC